MINYIYWKTGQGVNFGSCEERLYWMTRRRLEKQGFEVEREAHTPELRAEQLRKIREQK